MNNPLRKSFTTNNPEHFQAIIEEHVTDVVMAAYLCGDLTGEHSINILPSPTVHSEYFNMIALYMADQLLENILGDSPKHAHASILKAKRCILRAAQSLENGITTAS